MQGHYNGSCAGGHWIFTECLPKKALDRLDCEGLTLKPSNIVVRAFDGSKRMVHGEVDIPVKVGSQTFGSTSM